MKKIIIAALAIVAMSSCNKDEQYSTSDNQVAVKFASSEIATRTSGNSWVADDLIGISMYCSGDTTTPLAENIEYSSDTEGNFTAKGNPIYYHNSEKVDFYAYYPYQSTMIDNIYKADISDQTNLGAIDFIWSSLTEVSKSNSTQKFYFDHCLSIIELNVSLKLGILTIEGTTVEIQGLNTTASFNALTGKIIDNSSDNATTMEMVVVESEPTTDGYIEELTATLMVLPETMGEDVNVKFTLSSGEELYASIASKTFTPGTITSYDVALGYDEVTFASSTIKPWSEQEDGDLTSQETTIQ